jgi:GTP cyclohydrolase IA
MAVDRSAAEQAIRSFLKALGHDPDGNPELSETPSLVTEAFANDLLSGYAVDVRALLSSESAPLGESGPRGLVIVRGVDVTTMCPHHLLPAMGLALVAYYPGNRIVGIGTLAKLVDAFARRLTLQETICDDVVRALMELAGARGAYCRLELTHACLAARGARQARASVVTVAKAGLDVPDGAVGGFA